MISDGFLKLATAVVLGNLISTFAFADGQGQQQQQQAQQQKQQEDQPIADVLVVKVHLDDKGQEVQEGATLIPLTVSVKFDSQGLNTQALEKDCDQAMQSAQEIPVKQSLEGSQVPGQVQEEFNYADSLTVTERAGWRVWTPYGSIGRGGYYGYGYYPYYGRSYHRSYYPRWGYYRYGRSYPYYYGHYRRAGSYGYHYYHR